MKFRIIASLIVIVILIALYALLSSGDGATSDSNQPTEEVIQ